ncbi:dimethylarginine dimethylaminohydrolase family protein [Oceanobacillus salinisoli]|uniref:dimethylarginine dimethylaminohydrolase family protein n=1 Tax=Oceanobacillus salinisoli TaxID=2678611 RepID=UPI0012E26800|nr:arginine deiminase family protein [Oceanobacillus salinisoli]
MEKATSKKGKISCYNEYHSLRQVIVVPPEYMEIKEVINTTQRHYLKENIDNDIAVQQHQKFVHTLESEGVNVIPFHAEKELNEQVFTRDIGFTIGNTFFIAALNKELRKPEEDVLKKWLNEQDIPYHHIDIESIEGGDVLVDNGKVWIGVSDRTTRDAIDYVQHKLPDYQVTPISIREDILHLDCTFNIISEDTAIIFKDGVNEEAYKILQQHYQLIEVSEEEQFKLGTNVFSIGNKKIISLPIQKRLNQELRRMGYDVIEVEFSEIIKSGGSFRCCTLPLVRE